MTAPRETRSWDSQFVITHDESGAGHLDVQPWCPEGFLQESPPPSPADIQGMSWKGHAGATETRQAVCLLASLSYWCRYWLALYRHHREIERLKKKAYEQAWDEASLAFPVLISRPERRIRKTKRGPRAGRRRTVQNEVPFLPFHLGTLGTPYLHAVLEILAAHKAEAGLDKYRTRFVRIIDAIESTDAPFWDSRSLETRAEQKFENWRGFAREIAALLRTTHRWIREFLGDGEERGRARVVPDQKLSRSAARVLRYVEDKPTMPTYDDMATALQMGRTTISSALKELRATGYLPSTGRD